MTENMEQSPPFLQGPQVPIMAQTKFADLTGVPPGVLEGWINRGYLPTLKVGKHTVINLVALTQDCIDQLPK